MKSILLFIALITLTSTSTDPVKIGKINAAKSEAKAAFNAGKYKDAIIKYKYLIDSLDVKEDEVYLNLANAYYLEKDTANASSTYQSLTSSVKKSISSKAHQQLGIIANQQGKFEQALNDFKQAIKADPANEDARYNYEMLKKKLDDKKKQEQQDKENKDQKKDEKKDDKQNQDQKKKEEEKKQQEDKDKKEQEKKDQQQKEQEKKDQEKKDQEKQDENKKDQKDKKQEQQQEKEPQDQEPKKKDDMQNLDRDKLQQMKISEEKARMILEAMKNQEKQYLQQQRRKATKAKDKNKPDW